MKIPFKLEDFRRKEGKTNRGSEHEKQRQNIKDDSPEVGEGGNKVPEPSSDRRKQE